jgi:hypothetical protein
MKPDTVLLMDPAYQLADLVPEYGFHRARLGGHDVDVESTRPQRRRDFEPDKAGANHDCAPRRPRPGDQCAAIVCAAQGVDMREFGLGDTEADRLGAGGEQQRAPRMPGSVGELYFARALASMATARAPRASTIPCSG